MEWRAGTTYEAKKFGELGERCRGGMVWFLDISWNVLKNQLLVQAAECLFSLLIKSCSAMPSLNFLFFATVFSFWSPGMSLARCCCWRCCPAVVSSRCASRGFRIWPGAMSWRADAWSWMTWWCWLGKDPCDPRRTMWKDKGRMWRDWRFWTVNQGEVREWCEGRKT